MRLPASIGSLAAVIALAAGAAAAPPSPRSPIGGGPDISGRAGSPAPRGAVRCDAPSLTTTRGTERTDTILAKLYASGRTYSELVGASTTFQKEWTDRYGAAVTPPDLLARARAVKGEWRILAVAADWCSDSYNNLPHIARLLDSVPTIHLRIVDTTAGSAVMRAHPTADGRSATPTLILLDASGNEAGCFVERPAALLTFLQRDPPLTSAQIRTEKRAWYAANSGVETIRDIVEMLEGAASGSPKCRARS